MTWLDAYFLFGLPLMFLGAGFAMYAFTSRLNRRDMERESSRFDPAE